ncbi:hypothetical protein ADL35_12390 [Streptomyces sp. NRRL WC-3753]|nr:hypothetical protein ADL35_12390 [Streptomyces sp. NRRL WC-3753]
MTNHTNQTALRDRTAAALYDHSHPGWAISFLDLDQDQRDTYLARADAVLAVLPAITDPTAEGAQLATDYAEERAERKVVQGKLDRARDELKRLRVGRAAVLREAADVADGGDDDACGCGGCSVCTSHRIGQDLRRMADEAETTATPRRDRQQPIYLSTPCAGCKHPYNWHVGGVCQFDNEVDRCGCIAFAVETRQDGAQR